MGIFSKYYGSSKIKKSSFLESLKGKSPEEIIEEGKIAKTKIKKYKKVEQAKKNISIAKKMEFENSFFGKLSKIGGEEKSSQKLHIKKGKKPKFKRRDYYDSSVDEDPWG